MPGNAHAGGCFTYVVGPTFKANGRAPLLFKPRTGHRFGTLLLHHISLLSHLAPFASLHPQHRHHSRHQFVQEFVTAMSNWTQSNVSRDMLRRIVEAGQLPPLTCIVEWKVPR
jgi:hypothetical protein